MADAPKEAGVPSRMLFLNVMLSGFVSLVVFVICAYAFIIPRLVDHEQRIEKHERTLAEITQLAAEDDEDDAEDEAAPAPAAPTPAAPAAPAEAAK